VRARDLNSAGDFEIVLRPVCERSGNYAYIDDIDTTLEQPPNELAMKIIAARPIVAADSYLTLCTILREKCSVCAANNARYFGSEILASNTANIVFAENVSR
jgi:hypothetical protein